MRSSSFGFFFLSCIGLLLAGAPQPIHASDLSYARIVRLSLANGDVQVSRPGHPSWETASQNMPITQGVTIGTNEGYAEIEFEDGTTAWISENTLVQFTELALADGGRITKLTLAQGTVSVRTALRRGDVFVLDTSKETIFVPKNGFFRVDNFHDGASVSVFGGAVQITSSSETKLVAKGQTLAYQAKLTASSLNPNSKQDNWDRWVVARARDAQQEAAQSVSYVGAPLSYGLADMSAYGSWNYFAGYGYGWQPNGIGSCWMPFMNGDWNFYPGFGWTWVSAEPWGWMPYHFGSWSYLPSNGWAWFPSEFNSWDPAPVDWYAAGNQVGWSPAGFGDPSNLMFEQITGGCGAGGASGAFRNRGAMRVSLRPGREPIGGGRLVPRRLMLTTTRLGHGNRISLSAINGTGQISMRSAEPLENGKAGMEAFATSSTGQRSVSRMFAATAPDTAHLQHLVSSANSKTVTMMRLSAAMPAASATNTFRAVNAMPTPVMPSRLPARATMGGQSSATLQGTSLRGVASSAASYSVATSRGPSTPASSASHGSAGKPH